MRTRTRTHIHTHTGGKEPGQEGDTSNVQEGIKGSPCAWVASWQPWPWAWEDENFQRKLPGAKFQIEGTVCVETRRW